MYNNIKLILSKCMITVSKKLNVYFPTFLLSYFPTFLLFLFVISIIFRNFVPDSYTKFLKRIICYCKKISSRSF